MPDAQGCRSGSRRNDRSAEAGSLSDRPETRRKRLTGRAGQLSGLAAEERVAAFLEDRGLRVIARRWRCRSGEIDLVCAEGETTVFVEVKSARDFSVAAQSLMPRQVARILAAASEFAGTLPAGQDSDMRFDVALVDRIGRIEIIGNALGA